MARHFEAGPCDVHEAVSPGGAQSPWPGNTPGQPSWVVLKGVVPLTIGGETVTAITAAFLCIAAA